MSRQVSTSTKLATRLTVMVPCKIPSTASTAFKAIGHWTNIPSVSKLATHIASEACRLDDSLATSCRADFLQIQSTNQIVNRHRLVQASSEVLIFRLTPSAILDLHPSGSRANGVLPKCWRACKHFSEHSSSHQVHQAVGDLIQSDGAVTFNYRPVEKKANFLDVSKDAIAAFYSEFPASQPLRVSFKRNLVAVVTHHAINLLRVAR
ncbi:hypothetical protein HPB51_023972 [Rhipicephalus microplus]|uniref:Uncharacterized protein n=1 Tax=Rhipicephalus microplus TaxID=6941 RepID=A0A9J6EVK1_RHIMP|nr:hypothetical protein HPB51_023972 [Rhipicephalus microplus]